MGFENKNPRFIIQICWFQISQFLSHLTKLQTVTSLEEITPPETITPPHTISPPQTITPPKTTNPIQPFANHYLNTSNYFKQLILQQQSCFFDSEKNDSELQEFYFYCQSKLQKQYLTARGSTEQFYPCNDLSIMQGLSESCFLQLF